MDTKEFLIKQLRMTKVVIAIWAIMEAFVLYLGIRDGFVGMKASTWALLVGGMVLIAANCVLLRLLRKKIEQLDND